MYTVCCSSNFEVNALLDGEPMNEAAEEQKRMLLLNYTENNFCQGVLNSLEFMKEFMEFMKFMTSYLVPF